MSFLILDKTDKKTNKVIKNEWAGFSLYIIVASPSSDCKLLIQPQPSIVLTSQNDFGQKEKLTTEFARFFIFL